MSYHTTDVSDLETLHETKRDEAARALKTLLDTRNHALIELQKTGGIFMYLSPAQQDSINRQFEQGSFLLEEIVRRSAQPGKDGGITVPLSVLSQAKPDGLAGPLQSNNSLKRITALRKNTLQFGIIRSRAVELSVSLDKSVTVFNYQYKTSCRGLFPLGVFSRLWRNIRRFFNRPYFSYRDFGYLRNLGAAAGFVLKMAEAPII
jgi:hypothetical protein